MKLAMLVTALSFGVAAAQPAPDPDPVERAKSLYVEGKRHYDVGDYAKAIAVWKRAYVLSPAPMLLFNMAQAYRLSGDCAQALRVYANYERESTNLPNRDELQQARERCNREPTGTNPPAPLVAADPVPEPIRPAAQPAMFEPAKHVERPTDDGRMLRLGGLAIGAGGIVLAGASMVFGMRASDRARAVERYRGEWGPAQQQLESEGRSARTLGVVSAVLGGVALIGGGAMYVAGKTAKRRSIEVVAGATSMEVLWFARF